MKLFKSSDANDLIQLHQSSQFALAEKKAKALLEDFPQEIILHNVLGVSLEAQKRGHSLFHYLPENLIYENGRVSALGNVFKLFPNKKIFFKKSKTQKIFLDDCDVILVRQDPPFNMSYITATYLLEMVSNKTLILNDPKSIRDHPEKLSMFNFKNIIPPTLISKNIQHIIRVF